MRAVKSEAVTTIEQRMVERTQPIAGADVLDIPYVPQTHEIRLLDLWIALQRRKVLLLVPLLLTVLGGTALSLFIPPVYESRAVLEIGKVAWSGLDSIRVIEDPLVVLQRLKEEHRIDDPSHRAYMPRLESVGHPRGSAQNLLVLKIRGHSPTEARDFVLKIAAPLLERHRSAYEEVRGATETRLHNLDAEIKSLEMQVSSLGRMVRNLEDSSQAAILAIERGTLLNMLATLKAQRSNLLLALSESQSYPTRLLGEPTNGERAVRPKPILYISVAVFVGVALGIFAALIAEFVSRVRREGASYDQLSRRP